MDVFMEGNYCELEKMEIKDSGIEEVPVEILEKVLLYLEGIQILYAAKVCTLWETVCQRIAKVQCFQNIPSDVVIELLTEQPGGAWGAWHSGVDWLGVWHRWLESTLVQEEMDNYDQIILKMHEQTQESETWAVDDKVTVTTVDGGRVYTGDTGGVLECLDWLGEGSERSYGMKLRNDNRMVATVNINDGAVHAVVVVKCLNVIITAGDTRLHFFPVVHNDNAWPELGSSSKTFTIGTNKHVSVFGRRFAVSLSDGSLEVHVIVTAYMGVATGGVATARVTKVARTKPGCGRLQWNLWQDKLTVLQTTGEILVYNTDKAHAELLYKSEPYMVIMYKNPCWMFRDVIFCSTLSSRGLLARTSYWLLGWDVQRRGRLFRVLSQDGLSSNDDIWCVTLRRRLLVCGTETGSLLVYEVEGEEGKDNEKGRHSFIDLGMEEAPLVNIRVAHRPVVHVDIAFSDGDVLIYYKTSNRDLACVKIKSKI